MEVSQIAELDSHVVLGGAAAHAFGMSDSAEFFTVLSDTLYREKKLAVVREVVCNGDDAHKMNGNEHLPVEITLTDTELTVKDFGPGIADERMVPIYCIYGKSTKVKEENQTGGFGLGSKAPFAYSDHFTVTSCHMGVRSVYAISRGGIDTDGKPSLTKMVATPTEESGLTVSIPLKKQSDRHEFERLIRTVVAHGGILATLNGEQLPRFDFSKVPPGSFCIAHTPTLTESPVYVKYGAVLYPVIINDPALAKKVEEFKSAGDMRIIVHAKPNTIGIAPSRENLSNSDRTIETLKVLLSGIKEKLMVHRDSALKILAKRFVEASTEWVPLKFDFNQIPMKHPTFSADPAEMAMQVLSTSLEYDHYGRFTWMRPTKEKVAKELMLAASKKFRDHRRMFRRLASAKFRSSSKKSYNGWFASHDNKHALRVLLRTGMMQNAYAYGYRRYKSEEDGYRKRGYGIHPVLTLNEPVAGKHFVLCRGKQQADGWLEGVRYTKDGRDIKNEVIFIVVRNLKQHEIEAIKKTVQHYKLKLTVLDIAPPAPKPKKAKVEPPKHTFYELAQLHVSGGDHIKMYGAGKSTMPQLTEAPVFIDMKTTQVDKEMYDCNVRMILKHKKLLLQAYPQVALAFGMAQKKQLIAQGARELHEVMAEDYSKLTDTPEMRFAAAAAKGWLCAARYDHSVDNLASQLMQGDMRWAKLLTHKKVIVSPAERKWHALFQLFREVPLGEADKDWKIRNKVDDTLRSWEKGQKLKGGYFDYLKPITAFWTHYRGETKDTRFDEDIMDMIKHLQRRASKSALTAQPETAKEAA